MILTLDICLALAFAGLVALGCIRATASGPGTDIGLTLLGVPLLLLMALVLAVCIFLGRFDWILGGRLGAFALYCGEIVSLTMLLMAAADRSFSCTGPLFVIAIVLAMAACLWTAHGFDLLVPIRAGRIGAASILGVLGLGGWVMAVGMGWGAHQDSLQAQEVDQQIKLSEEEFSFRNLPEDAPLGYFLAYMNSKSPSVRQAARERIARWPKLDSELIGYLTAGYSLEAASYIANLHSAPTAEMAVAYGRFLEDELENWKPGMAGSMRPEWRVQLKNDLRGAERIQQAGGDLTRQLQGWHELLKQYPELKSYEVEVERIMGARPTQPQVAAA